jgi:RNA recognition motif-containing protein
MQGNKLYVGNLNYAVSSRELTELFSNYGQVESVNIVEGKGFGFVEMANQAGAENAKEKLDGYMLKGRALKVNEAKPRNSSPRRNFSRRY